MAKARCIVGIDEAGRGPLAGPVAVGAAWYEPSDKKLITALKELFPRVRDSKQFSETRREVIYEALRALSKTTTLTLRVALVSSKVIDARGIVFAIKRGVVRVTKDLRPKDTRILLDGGLKAPSAFVFQETHVRGDANHLPIALASIAAKVVRDRHMHRLSRRFPGYGFEAHKGYGTKRHYLAIHRHGLSELHRRSFIASL